MAQMKMCKSSCTSGVKVTCGGKNAAEGEKGDKFRNREKKE